MADRRKMAEKPNKNLIITIDGPSGAGKSTVARMVALALGYRYIDTGAMYRGVAYAYKILCDVREDSDNMEQFLRNLPIKFEFENEARVFLEFEDISEKIRDPEISLLASKLSQERSVREYLTVLQREAGKNGGVVLEGRDMGSVVFPDAHLKFYLDANQDERAQRRHLELSSKGIQSLQSVVKEEMQKRDKDDSERKIAPLVIPEHAIYIDTSELDARGVVDGILNVIFRSEE
jgi:CMP/dCMP kinase